MNITRSSERHRVTLINRNVILLNSSVKEKSETTVIFLLSFKSQVQWMNIQYFYRSQFLISQKISFTDPKAILKSRNVNSILYLYTECITVS